MDHRIAPSVELVVLRNWGFDLCAIKSMKIASPMPSNRYFGACRNPATSTPGKPLDSGLRRSDGSEVYFHGSCVACKAMVVPAKAGTIGYLWMQVKPGMAWRRDLCLRMVVF